MGCIWVGTGCFGFFHCFSDVQTEESISIFVLLGSFSVQAKLITEHATGFKKYILLPPEMGLFDFGLTFGISSRTVLKNIPYYLGS